MKYLIIVIIKLMNIVIVALPIYAVHLLIVILIKNVVKLNLIFIMTIEKILI